MQRDREAAAVSRQRLQVRAHDVGDTADDRRTPQIVHRTAPLLPAVAERFEGDVETDLVPVFETIRHGLRRAEDPNGHALNLMFLDLGCQSLTGKMNDPQRHAVLLWS